MTNFGICLLSCVPVRLKNSDKSEMVTQLLFGELFTILDATKNWLKIKITDDNYEGWIDKKQAAFLSEEEYQMLDRQPKSFCVDLVNLLEINNGLSQPILFGSTFPNLSENTFKIKDVTYTFSGYNYLPEKGNPSKELLLENALAFIHTPYLWGGKTPFGIDCSGFTQVIYKSVGIKIPRDASQQINIGEKLYLLPEATPGDLLFFGKTEEHVSHVGILLSDEKVIHASGEVRIDKIDHFGIYNDELKDYTHRLISINKIF